MTKFEVEESKFQYKFTFNGYTKVIISKSKIDEFMINMDENSVLTDGKKTFIFTQHPLQEFTEIQIALDGKRQSYKLWDSEKGKIRDWYKSQR